MKRLILLAVYAMTLTVTVGEAQASRCDELAEAALREVQTVAAVEKTLNAKIIAGKLNDAADYCAGPYLQTFDNLLETVKTAKALSCGVDSLHALLLYKSAEAVAACFTMDSVLVEAGIRR